MSAIVRITCQTGGGTSASEVVSQAVLDPNAGCPSYPGAPVIDFVIISQTDEGESLTVGGAVNSSNSTEIFDEFIGGTLHSRSIGELGWTAKKIHMFGTDAQVNHPGIAAGYVKKNKTGCLSLSPHEAPSVMGSSFFNMAYKTLMFKVDSDATLRLGLLQNPHDYNLTEGIYLGKNDGDLNFFGTCISNDILTRVDLGVPIDRFWHTFRLRRISSTMIGFRLDNAMEYTITSNISTVAMNPAIQIRGSAGDVQGMMIDRFDLSIFNLMR